MLHYLFATCKDNKGKNIRGTKPFSQYKGLELSKEHNFQQNKYEINRSRDSISR